MANKLKFLIKNDQNGQALLFAIVAMTIALGLGINIAFRTISTTSRVTNTDISQRALSAAEGAVERVLSHSDLELEEVAVSNPGEDDCKAIGLDGLSDDGNSCAVSLVKNDNDKNTSYAEVKVSKFRTNSSYSGNLVYEFVLEEGTVTEVIMDQLTSNQRVYMCIWPLDETNPPILYYFFWGYNTGEFNIGNRGYISVGNTTASSDISVTINPTINSCSPSGNTPFPSNGYFVDKLPNNSNFVSAINDTEALRLYALDGGARVTVWASPINKIGVQGYLIQAKGSIYEEGRNKITRTVSVYRSKPFLNGLFDMSFYSGSAIDLN